MFDYIDVSVFRENMTKYPNGLSIFEALSTVISSFNSYVEDVNNKVSEGILKIESARSDLTLELNSLFSSLSDQYLYDFSTLQAAVNLSLSDKAKQSELDIVSAQLADIEQDTLILKNKTEFPFKNIILNGDFSGGINSWIAEGLSTNEVVNGVLINTGGLNTIPRFRQNIIPGYVAGKKIAIKMRARVTNEFCTKSEVRLVVSGMTTQQFTFQDAPIKDKWYEKTIICTFAPSGVGNTFGLQINHIYASVDIANGKQMEIEYICGFDLTGIFGVANEPTADKFNEFLSYFPSNSIFDGVSELSVNMLSKTLFNYITKKYNEDTNVSFFDTNKDSAISTEGFTWQDITFVGDYLWAFRHSDVDGIDAGVGVIYIFDKNMNLVNQLSHNFGHTNTVDYNADNDTLIFGNGSGYKDTDGEIYIIQGVKHWVDFETNTELDLQGVIAESVITKIQVFRDFNDKVNVCWGENINGLNNICYVLSADGQWISKLVLGKGSNQLESGQFATGRTSTQYNGTYKQTSRHLGDKIEVIQGAQYYNGYIYMGMGHDGLMLVKHKLNSDLTMTREIKQEVAYDENGVVIDFASEGVAVKDGFIYHSVFGSINKLFKYRVF